VASTAPFEAGRIIGSIAALARGGRLWQNMKGAVWAPPKGFCPAFYTRGRSAGFSGWAQRCGFIISHARFLV